MCSMPMVDKLVTGGLALKLLGDDALGTSDLAKQIGSFITPHTSGTVIRSWCFYYGVS